MSDPTPLAYLSPRRHARDEETALAEAERRRVALSKSQDLDCVARRVTDAIGANA